MADAEAPGAANDDGHDRQAAKSTAKRKPGRPRTTAAREADRWKRVRAKRGEDVSKRKPIESAKERERRRLNGVRWTMYVPDGKGGSKLVFADEYEGAAKDKKQKKRKKDQSVKKDKKASSSRAKT